MIKIDQTIIGKSYGNCFAACLASMLECRIEDVPDISECGDADERWFHLVCDWLEKTYGLYLVAVQIKGCPKPRGVHMIWGQGYSDNGEIFHSVVGLDGLIVHDPHPSRKGLKTKQDYCYLVPVNPISRVIIP